jgi:hypothetical protein
MLGQDSSANFFQVLVWTLLELGKGLSSSFLGLSLDKVDEDANLFRGLNVSNSL